MDVKGYAVKVIRTNLYWNFYDHDWDSDISASCITLNRSRAELVEERCSEAATILSYTLKPDEPEIAPDGRNHANT